MYVVSPLSAIAVRTGAADRSEMLSQLLFGEMGEVLENKGKSWVKIRCIADNLVGWVDYKQVMPITPAEYALFKSHFAFTLDLLHPVLGPDEYLPVSIGARLPNFDGMRFQMGGITYTFSGQAVFPADIQPNAGLLVKIARRFLKAPCLPGGKTPLGIDSAGLVQLVYQVLGVSLPRLPDQQVHFGHSVDFVAEAQPGDLAFFEDKKGNIDHVGILLPDSQIIHAYGQVRIDALDHFGIFQPDTQQYSHKLRVLRRFLPEAPKTAESSRTQGELFTAQMPLF